MKMSAPSPSWQTSKKPSNLYKIFQLLKTSQPISLVGPTLTATFLAVLTVIRISIAIGKIAFCNNCTMSMKISSCKRQWFLKLHVQDSTNLDTNFRRAVFHNEVKKLFLMWNVHTSASEDEVLEKLLDLQLVKILYDNVNQIK